MELSVTHELHPRADRASARTGARTDAPFDVRPLQRYAIISELGGGGMSTVHLAHDRVTGRVVVIKRIADHAARLPGAAQRFAREAGIVAQLRHPNIVETVAVERDGATPTAIVTEYVRGASLRDMLAASGALPIDRVVRVLRDAASALAYTHARHIVHGDVKPANILVDSDTERALLADFGIARECGAHAGVGAGLTIGTPAYMAPEQIEGRAIDARADVYALCVVGWEMLVGRMPWTGAPLADVLHRQRYESLPDLGQLRPDIPIYLLHAINGGLAKDPAMRWRDGSELLRALAPAPTPATLPLPLPRRASAPLDATVQIETRAMQETPREHDLVTSATSIMLPSRQRSGRVRLLATTVATVAVALALGGLAPHLSHATTRSRPTVDPELDSMLTLAVMPHREGVAVARSARASCRVGTSAQATRCAPPPRRQKSSRTHVRHRRR